jgi:hypothetical protein
MTPEDKRADKKYALLENQARLMMQSFDTVQVFATKYEGENTRHYVFGSGNWYARYGQIRQWVNEVEGEAAALGATRLDE